MEGLQVAARSFAGTASAGGASSNGHVKRHTFSRTRSSSFCSFSSQNGAFGQKLRVSSGPHDLTITPRHIHRGPIRSEFAEKEEALVKDTWAVLKKDAGHHAMVLFNKVFEVAPSAKKLFSFLKDTDVPVEQNPKLKSHALKVFVIICEAATSLRKKGEVSMPGSTMQDMVHSHSMSGVVDEHYEVVKYCLLKTLEEGLPEDKWNEEVKAAWGEAYDELVAAMKATYSA